MSRRKECNVYDLSGDFGVGFASNTGSEFYFDLEDYERIKGYYWNEHILSSGYHTLDSWSQDSKNVIRMPWIIVGKWYDHINHNPLDNRKANLRKVSQRENIFNRGIQKTNNSGIIGVYWVKDRQKWRAALRKDGKIVFVKDCDSFLSATKERLRAEMKFFGEYAPQMHLFKQYGIM